MPKQDLRRVATSSDAPFSTPELVEACGKNDRDLLTLRVKLLLDAKKVYPTASFGDLAHLANVASGCGSCCCPCGCGSCCCASSFGYKFTGDPAQGL